MNKDDFGELLKVLRKQHKMTQADLADKLNVTTASVSKWETGKNLPNNDIQDKLCLFFNLSHNELHNPAIVLSHLSQTVEAASEKEPAIKPLQKFFMKKTHIIIFSIAVLLTVAATAVILFLLHRQNIPDSLSFYYVDTRYCFDDYTGEEVFECSCVYFGVFTPENFAVFSENIREEWLADSSLRPDVNVLKLSFYKDKQDALAWKTTQDSIYIFR